MTVEAGGVQRSHVVGGVGGRGVEASPADGVALCLGRGSLRRSDLDVVGHRWGDGGKGGRDGGYSGDRHRSEGGCDRSDPGGAENLSIDVTAHGAPVWTSPE